MTQLNSVRELQRQPFERAISSRARKVSESANWLASAIKQRDFLVVLGFCAIGLICTLVVMMQLQGFADVIADINLVP
ncbi:MAG: hypothetical protein ACRECV_19980 [Xanthobacteraceae bacterium]